MSTGINDYFTRAYRALRRRTAAKLGAWCHALHTSPTSVLHSVWERMAGETPATSKFSRNFKVVLHSVLVDRWRRLKVLRDGGGALHVDIDDVQLGAPGSGLNALQAALDITPALAELRSVKPRMAAALSLFWFEGLTGAEIATRLKYSERQVDRYLRFGLAWLRTRLTDEHNAPEPH